MIAKIIQIHKISGAGSPPLQNESPPDRSLVMRPLFFTGASRPVDHHSFIMTTQSSNGAAKLHFN